MAESVKKRSEIEEQDTWKLEDMIESPEKFEELMDGVEERIQEYEAYREKLGNSAEYLKNYLTYDESVDETLSLLLKSDLFHDLIFAQSRAKIHPIFNFFSNYCVAPHSVHHEAKVMNVHQ